MQYNPFFKKILYSVICILLMLAGLFLFLRSPLQKVQSPNSHHSNMQLRPVSFLNLPGWGTQDLSVSFVAFQTSCHALMKPSQANHTNNSLIQVDANDWRMPCQIALSSDAPSTHQDIQHFFQTWFEPVEFYNGKPVTGLFTGYYRPSVHGSLTQTSTYTVPIYGVPNDLITLSLHEFDPIFKNKQLVGRLTNSHHLQPYYTTADINNGALADKAPVLAWVSSDIDRLFLQIQGSGIIILPDGSHLNLEYAAQNGHPYTAIGGVLIKKGILTADKTSMQSIRAYLESHPDQIQPIINQNKSFVFFKPSQRNGAIGSQGTVLTPGYSMAIDVNWIPLGVPIWLHTTQPKHGKQAERPFSRLMIAQDTGGAIRGPVRGDVFWGSGKKATSISGHMKQSGYYWLLLPKKTT